MKQDPATTQFPGTGKDQPLLDSLFVVQAIDALDRDRNGDLAHLAPAAAAPVRRAACSSACIGA